MPLVDLYPVMTDRAASAAALEPHYFFQDLWAARKVKESGCAEHVDVGSRVDGFVAHCSLFTHVVYVDLRQLPIQIPNLSFRQGSIMHLPFEDARVKSLSSLHVIEHIGLGRYGDPLDPEGTEKALRELRRVLAPGGRLYLGAPVGRERVCFNAHRVLDPDMIPEFLSDLQLREFCAVDDDGKFRSDLSPGKLRTANFACGLYCFEAPE